MSEGNPFDKSRVRAAIRYIADEPGKHHPDGKALCGCCTEALVLAAALAEWVDHQCEGQA